MSGTAETALIGRRVWPRSVVRLVRQPLVLRVLAVAMSCAAMAMLARQADDQTLDYGVGIVPLALPWLSASSSIAVTILSLSNRRTSSAAGSLLLGALVVATAWSVVMLPFDALRIVRLVPLPLSAWGMGTRLLLLVGSACALDAALAVRQARQERCVECGRVIPGRLDRIPRWPVAMAVVSAMVYPVLRLCWALGSTIGTATGEPLELDIVLAWAPVVAGLGLVAFAAVLAVAGGSVRLRAFLGFGGGSLGLMLTAAGGLGAAKAAAVLATEGPAARIPDADLMAWVFFVVYGSWFLAGVGIIAGSWRLWSHRRDTCPACRVLMGRP
jgi:hypothetical protein